MSLLSRVASAALAVPIALAASAPAFAEERPAVDPLIVGGVDATDDNGAVSLWLDGRDSFCGGTLVSPVKVVTAAHCMYFKGSADAPKPVDEMYIRWGTRYLNDGPTARVEKVVVHPEWDWGRTPGEVGDVAVITLAAPVSAMPAKLAWRSSEPGEEVRLLGWGYTDQQGQGPSPEILQQADTLVAADDRCASGGISGPTELCVADELPHAMSDRPGPCFGDSGAPAVVQQGRSWRVVGWASRSGVESSPTPTPCGGHPDIYTDAASYLPWIVHTVAAQ